MDIDIAAGMLELLVELNMNDAALGNDLTLRLVDDAVLGDVIEVSDAGGNIVLS